MSTALLVQLKMLKHLNWRHCCGLVKTIEVWWAKPLGTRLFLIKIGRKEMFYLITHSTHFIYGYVVSWHMVKNHGDGQWKLAAPLHGLLFLISIKNSFVCTTPTKIAHTTTLVTPADKYWLEPFLWGPPWGINLTTHSTISRLPWRYILV